MGVLVTAESPKGPGLRACSCRSKAHILGDQPGLEFRYQHGPFVSVCLSFPAPSPLCVCSLPAAKSCHSCLIGILFPCFHRPGGHTSVEGTLMGIFQLQDLFPGIWPGLEGRRERHGTSQLGTWESMRSVRQGPALRVYLNRERQCWVPCEVQ